VWIYWLLIGFALLAWIMPMMEVKLSRWRLVPLAEISPDGAELLPRLSVIVAALNEEAAVEQAMRSLLALDYPALEIIAVDDRSTDQTGAILDRLSAGDDRLRVIHVRELPAGWLGKNHALHVGSLQASGDFLLFTDADVRFDPTALRRAVRYALARRLDHLALFPELILKGFWETACVWFWGLMFSVGTRLWKVSDPRSRAYVGIGAFNLVRTEAYRRAGGHAALPLDVTDDLKLGKKIKANGGRAEIIHGGGLVKVRWIEGVSGLAAGLTKNMYAGFGYRAVPALRAVAAVFLLATWPAIGLFVGPWETRALCACAPLLMVYAAAQSRPCKGASPLYSLAFPIAGLVFIYIVLRSMLFTHLQGGIRWRGTFYPLAELRKGVV
jgi:glycosyltransferase involved in cell wall biosynthesis